MESSTWLAALDPALKELKKGLLPLSVMRTLWAFAIHPSQLLYRAEGSKPESPSAPIPFYIACISVAILLVSFLGKTQGDPTWARAFLELSESSARGFEHYFNISDDERRIEWLGQQLPIPITPDSTKRIEYLVGSIDAVKVGIYLRDCGQIAIGDEMLKAASRAKARTSRENKIGIVLAPLILAGLTFVPHLILKTKSHNSVIATLFYYQGFWLILLACLLAAESHWVGSFVSERSEARAAAFSGCFFYLGLAHLFIILFITTSASVERILFAGMAWVLAPVPVVVVLQVILAGVDKLL